MLPTKPPMSRTWEKKKYEKYTGSTPTLLRYVPPVFVLLCLFPPSSTTTSAHPASARTGLNSLAAYFCITVPSPSPAHSHFHRRNSAYTYRQQRIHIHRSRHFCRLGIIPLSIASLGFSAKQEDSTAIPHLHLQCSTKESSLRPRQSRSLDARSWSLVQRQLTD